MSVLKRTRKRLIGSMLAAAVLVSNIVPTCAATVKYTFTKASSVYGITTQCSNFSGKVTAWAKVANNGKYTYSSRTGNKAATATAKRTCTSGTVSRTGGYIS